MTLMLKKFLSLNDVVFLSQNDEIYRNDLCL